MNNSAKPDNTRLLELLTTYVEANGGGNSYQEVVSELMNGNSFLMIPTIDSEIKESTGWKTTKSNTSLKISSLREVDGIKVLGVFTDGKVLLSWTKRPISQTSMKSQDVLKLCVANGIQRLVINSGSPNMFVLEREPDNVAYYQIPENTTLLMGPPADPLPPSFIEKLTGSFAKFDFIKEVYKYGQTKKDERRYVYTDQGR